MNAAVIGAPERSEMPEVGPKDTERARAVKPGRLRGPDPDTMGQRRIVAAVRPTISRKMANEPKTPAAGHAMLTLTAIERLS
jgi:hypothetical protein